MANDPEKERFLKEFGRDYGYPGATKSIDDLRANEFKRLKVLGWLQPVPDDQYDCKSGTVHRSNQLAIRYHNNTFICDSGRYFLVYYYDWMMISNKMYGSVWDKKYLPTQTSQIVSWKDSSCILLSLVFAL